MDVRKRGEDKTNRTKNTIRSPVFSSNLKQAASDNAKYRIAKNPAKHWKSMRILRLPPAFRMRDKAKGNKSAFSSVNPNFEAASRYI